MRFLKISILSAVAIGLLLFPSTQAEAAAQGTTTVTICIPGWAPWIPPQCTTFVINISIPPSVG